MSQDQLTTAVTLNLKTPLSLIQHSMDYLLHSETESKKKRLMHIICVSNRNVLNEVTNYADYLLIKRG